MDGKIFRYLERYTYRLQSIQIDVKTDRQMLRQIDRC